MLILGLVGGSESRRDHVAGAFLKLAKARLGAFSLRSPTEGPARAKLLDDVIVNFKGNKSRGTGLILPHVITRDEAELIRKKGGFLLHVDGVPSSCIPILRGDLMVTAKPGGERHYLDPIEALSEVSARYASQA